MKSVYDYLTERVITAKPTEEYEIVKELGLEIANEIANELDVSLGDIKYEEDQGDKHIIEVDGKNYMFIKEDDVEDYIKNDFNSLVQDIGFSEGIAFLDKSSQQELMQKGAYKFLKNANDIIEGQREDAREYYNEDEDLQEEYEDEDAYIKARGLEEDNEESFENAMSELEDYGHDMDNIFSDKNIDWDDFFEEITSGKYTVGHNGRTLTKDLLKEDIGHYQEVYELKSGILARCDY